MNVFYLDGQYIKANAKILKNFTPGNFKGTGVFETMLGLDGVVLDVALHLKRLRRGLKVLGIKPPAINPLILMEIVRRNHLNLSRVRLMVWQEGNHVHMMIAALPYKVPAKKIYRACLVKTDRQNSARFADVKSLDYALFAQAQAQAKSRGLDVALLLNRRNFIFEGSYANIFWFKDRVLYTPPLSCGCLNGITRGHVIQQAKRLKITVKERNLTPKTLKASDGAFLTNSLIGLMPVDTNV